MDSLLFLHTLQEGAAAMSKPLAGKVHPLRARHKPEVCTNHHRTPPQSDLAVPKCRQICQLPQRRSQGGCTAFP